MAFPFLILCYLKNCKASNLVNHTWQMAEEFQCCFVAISIVTNAYKRILLSDPNQAFCTNGGWKLVFRQASG